MKAAIVYAKVLDRDYVPFGPLYITSTLRNVGVAVTLFRVSKNRVELDLRDFDLVAFSISSTAAYNIIKKSRLRSIYSGKQLIAVGGVHPTLFPEQSLQDIRADVVCVGAGEGAILDLLDQYEKRRFSEIPGVCYFDGEIPKRTPPRVLPSEISWLPLPARDMLDEKDFIFTDILPGGNARAVHVMISRGCPFTCRFCAVTQKQMQYRSGMSLRAELEHLVDHYGIEGFYSSDDNLASDKTKLKDVCESIKSLGLKWSTFARIGSLNQNDFRIMKESGCVEIKLGVESGSDRILKAMNKGITRGMIIESIKSAFDFGFYIKIMLLHGFPGENAETTRETISLVQECLPMIGRVSLTRFFPSPGSFVFANPQEYGLTLSNNWDDYYGFNEDHHWWGGKREFGIIKKSFGELAEFLRSTGIRAAI